MEEINPARTAITNEQWARLQDLFLLAVDLSPADRDAVLAAHCQGDTVLRRQVESLIAASINDDSWLVGSIHQVAESVIQTREPSAGDRAGAWQLIRPLGTGGMGTVWLAERADDQFAKLAAIKFVRSGFGAAELINRFRVERQALASLEHPNIARLLDAGLTGANLPFLVMEFVEGESIVDYCESRNLGARERIQLFRQICDAVQAAHGQFIVHRDLKPANILVSSDGVPKLLDFGIAKLLDNAAATDVTSQTQRLMTPEYASPEQVRGETITVATDIWGLSAVLFTLLAGRSPFLAEAHGMAGLERAICEQEAPAVSGISKLPIDSDVDAIIAKGLRKEPAARYTSAADLAADLGRYLNGYPVEARKGNWRYRAAKFARRHWVSLAAAAVVTVAITGGVVSTVQAQRRAERRFAQVRDLTGKFLFEIYESIKAVPGTTPAQSLITKRGLQYLDGLATEAQGDLSLQGELATSYENFRDIQGGLFQTSLNDSEASLQSAEKAIAIRQAMVRAQPDNRTWRMQLAGTLTTTALYYLNHGKLDRAQALDEEALRHVETLAGAPRTAEFLEISANAYSGLAQLARLRGNSEQAIAYATRGIAFTVEIASVQNNNASSMKTVSIAYVDLGDGIRQARESDPRALDAYREALKAALRAEVSDPVDVVVQRQIALVQSRIGIVQNNAGLPLQALENFQDALHRFEAIVRKDPDNGLFLRSVAVQRINSSESLILAGRYREAVDMVAPGVAYREARAAQDKTSFEAQDDLGNAYTVQARALTFVDPAQAARVFDKAIAIRQALLARDPERAEYQFRMGRTYVNYGELRERQRQSAEARLLYTKGAELFARHKERGKLSTAGAKLWDVAKAGLARLGHPDKR